MRSPFVAEEMSGKRPIFGYGDGRYDISLFPRKEKYPGILMELKPGKEPSGRAIDALLAEALRQIDDKGYDSEMREDGVTNILKLGIAFSGKKARIREK